MASGKCGGAGCLLNGASNEERRRNGEAIFREETVICPRHFWGYRVPIEVPAQQVKGVKGEVAALPRVIASVQPTLVLGGFNPNLELAQTHADELETSVFALTPEMPAGRARLLRPARPGRDALRALLQQQDPDIVYFFCHALEAGPSLDFGRGYEGVLNDVLQPHEFTGTRWTHAPLVFINGCSTAGFTPYAVSEFIPQFIRGGRASAVIGTEVAVWEMLATAMATAFLHDFLNRESAGDALLRARRVLLAKSNPLGLAYTLYGSAELTLARPAKGG